MANKLEGDAYQTQEVHNGPPKSYISEKLNSSIIAQYRLIKAIDQNIPDSFSSDLYKNAPSHFNMKSDIFLSHAYVAFNSMLTSFLALHNRLGLMDNDIVKELLNGTEDSLKAWLTRAEFIQEV